jgi:thiol:disulfide interchange protein DsbD
VTALFDAWEQRLPRRPEELGVLVSALHSQSAVRPGDDFETALSLHCEDRRCAGLALPPVAPHEAFVPDVLPGVELRVVGHQSSGSGFAIVLSGRASPDPPGALEQRIAGLVPVSVEGGSVLHLEVAAPLPRAARDAVVLEIESPLWTVTGGFESPAVGLGLLYALALGLLGGLVLNLMPCVLPVLAIKVFRVAEIAHESRRALLAHGAAYTGGVLASMAALAAIVVALRAAGIAVGWGFQFQEPLFVAAICTLLVVFALNLFGVFEVSFQPASAARVSAEAAGYRRSFFEGLLAVILATPCTAPFLGTAVGFAFASDPGVIFAIFLSIGFGLAAPYAAVTLVPGLSRVVPRPGAWMLALRSALGFSLVATAVWLLWVVGRSVGVDAQALLLGYLVAVAFGLWVLGSLQRVGRGGLVLGAVGAVVAGIALGLAGLPLDPPAADRQAAIDSAAVGVDEWRPYDLAAIGAELARGRPVLVDFTADWCITCKVNESVVLADRRVKAELARLDVATFKADWTLYDEEIGRVLASFGKAGVPMYLVYGPSAPGDPRVLPELLTVDLVIEALQEAAGPAARAALDATAAEPSPGPPEPNPRDPRGRNET